MHPELKPKDRYHIMRMMFGGHEDAHDVHQCGLTAEFLADYMKSAGFRNLRRVEDFSEFKDSSQMRFGGQLVSLNVEAYK